MYSTIPAVKRITFCIACIFALLTSNGCAASTPNMYYQFAFDMTADGQHAVVLEYKLSAGNQPLITSIPSARTRGLSGEGIYKNGPRPTGMSIRWKDLPTGQEFFRDVDFQGHLDEDLNGATIYAMINGDHLSIYLVLASQKAAGQPDIGPRIYNDRAIKLIYSN